jgi:hypothetical protein
MARHRAAAALLLLLAAAAAATAQAQQTGDEVPLSLHGDGAFDATAYSYPISQYPGCGDAPVEAGEAGVLEPGLTDCTLSPTLSGPGTTILYTFRVPDDAASASPMSINFQLRVSGGDVDMCACCFGWCLVAQRGVYIRKPPSSSLRSLSSPHPHQTTSSTNHTHTKQNTLPKRNYTKGAVLPGRRARQPAERAAVGAVQPAERAGEPAGRAARRPRSAARRVGAAPDRQPRHQAQGDVFIVVLWVVMVCWGARVCPCGAFFMRHTRGLINRRSF